MSKNMKIWTIGTEIRNYVERFQIIADEEEGDFFSIKKMSNGYCLINEQNKDITEKLSDSTIQQILSIWISLGFIEIKNCLTKKSPKKSLIDNNYEILLKKQRINNNFIQNFHKRHSKRLWKYIENLISTKSNSNPQLQEMYSNEKMTYYNIFLGSLVEKETSIKQRINRNELSILTDYWTNTGLVFDDEWYKIAELFCFGKKNKIDSKSKEEYKPNYQDELNLIIENQESEYPIKQKNLDVKNYNLSSFLNFLNTKKYYIKIPIYQRDYVWNKEIFLNLIQDIINEANEKSREKKAYHYIGEISFFHNLEEYSIHETSFKPLKLIDGQQRITSLFIIWRILYSYASLNPEKYTIDKFTYDYFKLIDSNQSNEILKKFQYIDGNQDSKVFHQIMLGNNKELKDKEQNTLMYQNFIAGYSKIEKEIFSKEKFHKVIKVLLNKIAFVGVIHSKNNEYDLFENLNSNNVSLKNIDLIKNYILMKFDWNEKISESKILDIFNQNIAKPLKNCKPTDLDNFLIIYCKLYQLKNLNGKIDDSFDSNTIFKEIIDKNLDKEQDGEKLMSFSKYNSFITKINKSIRLFLSIINPPKDSINETYTFYNIADILSSLKGKNTYNAILMFLIEPHINFFENNYLKINDLNNLRKKLFAIETFAIPFKVLGDAGTSFSEIMDRVLEKIYKAYQKNKGNISYKEIDSEFRELTLLKSYTMDDFEKKLANEPIMKSKLIEQLCLRLEFFIDNDFRLDWWNTKRDNIGIIKKPSHEHIMPEKNDNWIDDLKSWNESENENKKILDDQTLSKQYNKYMNFLGNAMTINAGKNSQLGNKKFSEKQLYYQGVDNSVLNLKQYNGSAKEGFELLSIKDSKTWNFDTIKKRSEQMAKIFKAIYSYSWEDEKNK